MALVGIAVEMGRPGNPLGRPWVKQADVDSGRQDRMTTAEREERAQLRRENRRLREDIETLNRATVFFVKETR